MFNTVTADGVAVTEEGDIVRGSRRLETVPHSPDPTEHGSQTDTAPRVQQRITRETRFILDHDETIDDGDEAEEE